VGGVAISISTPIISVPPAGSIAVVSCAPVALVRHNIVPDGAQRMLSRSVTSRTVFARHKPGIGVFLKSSADYRDGV
jgi:hypothetical protein